MRGGFTCTGLCYDLSTNNFYIGNAGKLCLEEDDFAASIEQVSHDFTGIVSSIECYKNFPDMKDIQGLTLDVDGNIFFCSYGGNLVRSVDVNGNEVGKFYIENPSGIAYEKRTDSLWVLTDKELVNCSKTGQKIYGTYKISEKGQDQLFIDENNNLIYFTCGTDYQSEGYVYTFDMVTRCVQMKYVLKDSYAIEGISIVGNKMYILNDGYYHKAKVTKNQVNIYDIS